MRGVPGFLRRTARPATVALGAGAIGLTLLVSGSSHVVHSAEGVVSLAGTITSGDGKKMEGVTVSTRAAGSNITTSVFTDSDGEYYFPSLPAGRYTVWAQAQAFDAGRAALAIGAAGSRRDFVLKPITDFEAQLSGDAWYAALPEASAGDSRMKEVFRLACMGCHTQNFTLIGRYDQRGWKNIIDVMSRVGAYQYGDPARAQKARPNPLMVRFGDELAAYLAKVRGPGPSPMTFKPRRPAGDSTLMVVREYDGPEAGFGLPGFNDGSDWSQGSPDFMDEAHHHTMNATLDFDGNLWMSDIFNLTHTVVKYDWKTGLATKYAITETPGGPPANSHDIFTDDKGIIWFDMSSIGAIGRVDPRTNRMETIRPPTGARIGPFIGRDGRGGIWAAGSGRGETTENNDVPIKAMRYDTKTRQWKMFAEPVPNTSGYGMAGDSQGNGWWATSHPIDGMIKADARTGETSIVKIPGPTRNKMSLFTDEERALFDSIRLNYIGYGRPGAVAVRKLGGGPRADAVWGAAWFGGALVKIDVKTNEVTSYPYPYGDANAGYEASIDKDGNVWVAFIHDDMIAKFNPATTKWTSYFLPTLGVKTHGLQAVTVNGRTQVAMGYLAVGKIAKMEFRTPAEAQALKAQARRAQ